MVQSHHFYTMLAKVVYMCWWWLHPTFPFTNDSASSYTKNKRKDDRHFIKHFYHWKNVVVTIKLFLNVRIAQIRIIMVLLGSLKLAFKAILTIGHILREIKEAPFIYTFSFH